MAREVPTCKRRVEKTRNVKRTRQKIGNKVGDSDKSEPTDKTVLNGGRDWKSDSMEKSEKIKHSSARWA